MPEGESEPNGLDLVQARKLVRVADIRRRKECQALDPAGAIQGFGSGPPRLLREQPQRQHHVVMHDAYRVVEKEQAVGNRDELIVRPARCEERAQEVADFVFE